MILLLKNKFNQKLAQIKDSLKGGKINNYSHKLRLSLSLTDKEKKETSAQLACFKTFLYYLHVANWLSIHNIHYTDLTLHQISSHFSHLVIN